MNKVFIGSAVLLIFGFLVLQLGFGIIFNVDLLGLGNNTPITDAGGLLFAILGGIILLLGLLASFVSITHDRRRGSLNTKEYLTKLSTSISDLEKKIENNTFQLVQVATSLNETKTEIATLTALSPKVKSPTSTPVSVSKVKSPTYKKDAPLNRAECKFCHTKIPEKTIFCTSCGRSQV